MTRLFNTLLLLLFASYGFAQVVICGKVQDAVTKAPIAGVSIEILELNLRTQSNDTGYFCLKIASSADLHLLLSKPNYSPSLQKLERNTYSSLNFLMYASNHDLEEVVVYGQIEAEKNQTSNTIEKIDITQMREAGAFNLSDGMSKLPGVRQLSTGPGISKPVVRGLFGNRIQTVLLGIRFDNQQWQDEHGLGLSTSGFSEVEIIKGPSSLFYGSEAMGGVINIIGEKAALQGKTQVDLNTQFFSNTYGYALDAGVRKSTEKWSWGLRLNSEAHADYSDGHNQRILNSRFAGNSAKVFLHYRGKKFSSENNYYVSQSNFGFLMDAYQLYDHADKRLARSFERPHHNVLLNLMSSQNTWFLKNSKLKLNAGLFFNDRQEQEGSGGISLYMLLNSYSALISWIKSIRPHTELVISSQNQFQTNRNIGSRIIVPDANISENSVSLFIKNQSGKFTHEGGIRYDFRTMQSLLTGALNTGNPYNPGFTVLPSNKQYSCFNAAAGSSFKAWKGMLLKVNVSSGYRSPNLAEFSSNGLHEGSLRYEIGNTQLKIEQNACADLSFEQNLGPLHFTGSYFYNAFKNYIYLQRTNQDYLGFTIYRYIQKDAVLKGFEGNAAYIKKKFELRSGISQVLGQTTAKENLPFIPATRLQSEIKWKQDKIRKFNRVYVRLEHQYVFTQNKFGQFETATPAYHLINAGLGSSFQFGENSLDLSLSGNNLLNAYYFDHLSRLKYFGIYNPGRNISLNLKFNFIK